MTAGIPVCISAGSSGHFPPASGCVPLTPSAAAAAAEAAEDRFWCAGFRTAAVSWGGGAGDALLRGGKDWVRRSEDVLPLVGKMRGTHSRR